MSSDRFQSWLARVPDVELTAYIGPTTVSVLRALDPYSAGPGALRKYLVSQFRPDELLRDRGFWRMLVESQPRERVEVLARELGLRIDTEDQSLFEHMVRIPSRLHPDLASAFGITREFSIVQDSGESTLTVESALGAYGLFDHQRVALNRLRPYLHGGFDKCRVVLHMPTGSGKTRTMMRLITEFLVNNEGKSALWIANSQELCDQASEEFLRAWKSIGNREVNLVRLWGGRKVTSYPQEGLFVASAQTLDAMRSSLQGGTSRAVNLARNLGLLVFDEAHQAIAPTYQLAVDFISSMHKDLPVFGLTATPGRTWDDIDEDRRLAEFFQGNKVMLEVPGYDSPVRYLIDNEYLAEPHFVPHQYEWEDQSGLASQIEQALDAPGEVLEKIGADTARNLLIRETIMQTIARHRRVLYFAPSVENSNAMAFLLRESGVQAVSITSRSPSSMRVEAIDAYRSPGSEVKVLCNFGVLTTGFDAPVTSAAVIARPTKSLVLYSQMVGRAMRGKRAGGNASCEIHTVVDVGLPGFNHPVAAFENWEDVWSSGEES